MGYHSNYFSFKFDGKGKYKFEYFGHIGKGDTTGIYKVKENKIYCFVTGSRANNRLQLKKQKPSFMIIDQYTIKSTLNDRLYIQTENHEYQKKTPNIFLNIDRTIAISDIKKVLSKIFSDTEVKSHLKLKSQTDKKIISTPYYEFNELNFPNLKVNDYSMDFKSTDLPKIYIDFEYIIYAFEDCILLSFKIIDKKISNFEFNYRKKDGIWLLENKTVGNTM